MQNKKVKLSRLTRDLELNDAELKSLINVSIKDEQREYRLTQEDIDTFLESYRSKRNITPYDGYVLPEYMDLSNACWLIALKKLYQMPVANPASLSPAQGELLRAILANISAKTVVEIGCFIGISTLWLAAGMACSNLRGRLYVIDTYLPKFPWPPFHYSCIVDPKSVVADSVERAGFSDIIHLIESDSKNAADNFDTWLGSNEIDLLFIDGDHSVDGCKSDFELYAPRVAVGGYIIFHDIFPKYCGHEGPRFVLDNFILNSLGQYQCVEIATTPANFGIALVKKVKV